MNAQPNRYRGIEINVEMEDGQFICAIHDPMQHKAEQHSRLEHTLSDSRDAAVDAAERFIDKQLDEEMADVVAWAKRHRQFK